MHANAENGGARGDEALGVLGEWMSRRELAVELSVCEDTLSRWETLRTGPPYIRLGRKVLYRRAAVREWLIEKERRSASGRRATQ